MSAMPRRDLVDRLMYFADEYAGSNVSATLVDAAVFIQAVLQRTQQSEEPKPNLEKWAKPLDVDKWRGDVSVSDRLRNPATFADPHTETVEIPAARLIEAADALDAKDREIECLRGMNEKLATFNYETAPELVGREPEDGGKGLLDKCATRLEGQQREIERLRAENAELNHENESLARIAAQVEDRGREIERLRAENASPVMVAHRDDQVMVAHGEGSETVVHLLDQPCANCRPPIVITDAMIERMIQYADVLLTLHEARTMLEAALNGD